MRFWDSSALVPLILPEGRTPAMERLAREDRRGAIWWAAPVECQGAIQRRHREGSLPDTLLIDSLAKLDRLLEEASIVPATDELRERARRLLGAHPVRAADALQLAAALVWCEERPRGERFVCLDDRLREAAQREGFAVLPASL